MSKTYLAFSYDTEFAVPTKLPTEVISPEEYKKLPLSKKKEVWGDYLGKRLSENSKGRSTMELETIKKLNDLFLKHNGRFTAFVLGEWLDQVVEELGQETVMEYLTGEGTDIQSHSYHNRAYKPIGDSTRERIAPTLLQSQISSEIRGSLESIHKNLGVRPIGMRPPMGNTHPLREDDKMILEALSENGIKFISSWLKKDQREPNPVGTKPLTYSSLGFPDIVEIPGIGFYDVHYTQPTRLLVFGEDGNEWSLEERTEYHIDLLKQAQALAKKREESVFVPLVMHPWSVANYDPDLKFHEAILKFCNKNDIQVVSFNDIYKEVSQEVV
jgi:peptidoglycan/xylan/chitin deacetylase (PgdA/CDA1 family)